MKRSAIALVIGITLVAGIFLLSTTRRKEQDVIRIGIVLPIEHAALNKISAGFQETIRNHPIGKMVHFKIANGQGDIQLETSQISQFFSQEFDYIVPVSTGTTSRVLAGLANHPDRSVIALAAQMHNFSHGNLDFTGVEDEIPMESMFKYLALLVPKLKSFAVVYSSSEKIFEEVSELEKIAKGHNTRLQKLMVHNLREVPELLPAIKPENQLIFILKDNLIAHGVSLLIPIANKLSIPLVTSDEGTVNEGADIGIGVSERTIGVEGAKIFLKCVESDLRLKDIKPVRLEAPTIYLNVKTKKKLPSLIDVVHDLRTRLNFPLQEVGAY